MEKWEFNGLLAIVQLNYKSRCIKGMFEQGCVKPRCCSAEQQSLLSSSKHTPGHQQLSHPSFGPRICCLDYLSTAGPSELFHVSFSSEWASFPRNMPVSSNIPRRQQPKFTEAACSQKTAQVVTSSGFHMSKRMQIFLVFLHGFLSPGVLMV